MIVLVVKNDQSHIADVIELPEHYGSDTIKEILKSWKKKHLMNMNGHSSFITYEVRSLNKEYGDNK